MEVISWLTLSLMLASSAALVLSSAPLRLFPRAKTSTSSIPMSASPAVLVLTSAICSVPKIYYDAAKIDGTPDNRLFLKITLPMISPTIFYLIITGFIGAFKAYSDAVALFGTDLNVAGMNTIVGYVYDMLYGDGGGYPSFASAAAIILFCIVLTITCINLIVSKKKVHY